MKMELIEGSETSDIRTQTPGNYPKENILHIEHGESLKSRMRITDFREVAVVSVIFFLKMFIALKFVVQRYTWIQE